MTVLTFKQRALALVMREAERAGRIAAPPELRWLVSTVDCSPEEIDHAFELLADSRPQIAELVGAGLIESSDDDRWVLTPIGEVLADLLAEYADPRHVWTSLIPVAAGQATDEQAPGLTPTTGRMGRRSA